MLAVRAMRKLTVGFVTMLTACAAEPPCDPPQGLYRTTLRELSGDCGELGPQLETTGGGEPPGCTRMDLPAGEGCGRNYRRRCVQPDGLVAELLIGVDRQDDDRTWAGTADLRILESGQQLCHSIYAVTFDQQ